MVLWWFNLIGLAGCIEKLSFHYVLHNLVIHNQLTDEGIIICSSNTALAHNHRSALLLRARGTVVSSVVLFLFVISWEHHSSKWNRPKVLFMQLSRWSIGFFNKNRNGSIIKLRAFFWFTVLHLYQELKLFKSFFGLSPEATTVCLKPKVLNRNVFLFLCVTKSKIELLV